MSLRTLYKCGSLGPIPLGEALQIQKESTAERTANNLSAKEDLVLFAEHNPVYTYGSGKKNKRLLREHAGTLENPKLPASLFPVDRGGSIMYHGPGQLTVYLVLNIEHVASTPFVFGHIIDQSIISLLKYFDIEAFRKPPSLPEAAEGVWVNHNGTLKKIASRGLKFLASSISSFGFGLNVSTDLSYFDYIYPCGLDIQITSMKEVTGRTFDVLEVAKRYSRLLNN